MEAVWGSGAGCMCAGLLLAAVAFVASPRTVVGGARGAHDGHARCDVPYPSAIAAAQTALAVHNAVPNEKLGSLVHASSIPAPARPRSPRGPLWSACTSRHTGLGLIAAASGLPTRKLQVRINWRYKSAYA